MLARHSAQPTRLRKINDFEPLILLSFDFVLNFFFWPKIMSDVSKWNECSIGVPKVVGYILTSGWTHLIC